MDSHLRSRQPNIIQGGMGIGVSTWRLAKEVARLGEIGVVSGTALDAVVVRELQDGDPHDRLAVLEDYSDQEIVARLRDRYFVEGGIESDESYRPKPIHRFRPKVRSQQLLAAATYSEVILARQGQKGIVGINLMAKLKRYTLPVMYGAMLAGVDIILMGAGIPMEEPRQLHRLAAGEPARLRLNPDTANPENDEDYFYTFDPHDLVDPPPELDPPAFFPIVSSDVLARILIRRLPDEMISGLVIEMPPAGGHNAPPRGKQYDDRDRPIYDEKDEVDLERLRKLDLPFFLAGGYGYPHKLAEAVSEGADGVQVGSLFSLTNESGYPSAMTRKLIRQAHRGELEIRTDGRVSPTGFPFKVIEARDTLGVNEGHEARPRKCDLGYLREPYVDEKGRMLSRCPAEPVKNYLRKGGDKDETHGRACLCNALMANIGRGQMRSYGREQPLYTGGDQLEHLHALPLGSVDHPAYSARDVIDYLYGEKRPKTSSDTGGTADSHGSKWTK